MKWNIKRATGICWSKLGYDCGRLEGISCMRCMIVKEFLADPCDIKFDHKAHESLDEFVAFLIQAANMGTESKRGC